MDFNIEEHLPETFSPQSRVWIYASDRMFFLSEAYELESMFETFLSDWKAHGSPVKGYVNLFFGRFIVLMADESHTEVSGCSIDSSVRLMKSIENKFQVNLFNRLLLNFLINEKVQQIPMHQLSYALENNFINEDTLFFNQQVLTRHELETNWIIPLKKSWLASRFNLGKSNQRS